MVPDNPFFITAHIPDRYFCDRKAETDKLIHYVWRSVRAQGHA